VHPLLNYVSHITDTRYYVQTFQQSFTILGQNLGRNLDYFIAILGIVWKNRTILGITNG
jgi:hypothetical protein